MKIAVSGASGLLGSHLVADLKKNGHTVVTLPHKRGQFELDLTPLPGCEAVVHLSGDNLSEGRWSEDKKECIYRSRVDTTHQLVAAISKLSVRPSVLVCASAVGFYGSRGDEILTEQSNSGDGFLAHVVRDWELAARAAEKSAVRVVNTRFGVILSSAGGALAKLLPYFRAGVGGPIGNGKQWMSWMALADVVAAIQFVISNESMHGPVNVMSPNPVVNREFAHTLGRVLHRPAIISTPAFVLKALLGEMIEETALASQRAVPEYLLRAGFQFQWPELSAALASAIAA